LKDKEGIQSRKKEEKAGFSNHASTNPHHPAPVDVFRTPIRSISFNYRKLLF
jgi:hypothetical protein